MGVRRRFNLKPLAGFGNLQRAEYHPLKTNNQECGHDYSYHHHIADFRRHDDLFHHRHRRQIRHDIAVERHRA
jgi:hypothetical protein